MPKKIVFIGAGSQVFTRNLCRDILTFPALADANIALVDVDDDNLALAKAAVDKIVELGKYPARDTATKDRVEALKGADGVLRIRFFSTTGRRRRHAPKPILIKRIYNT
ncbi:MAG: hypothetical protein LBU58_06885 [Clostridiales bacterium]|jgi:alpha-galactosidase|nr:hypothetical protein [Clostridiales bacterium]